MGEAAALRVPLQVFHGHPAHALGQSALDLAAIHGGIDGAAEVVNDLHLVDGVGAAQAIDRHLEYGGAVDVIGERVAVLALLVVVDARRGVVAVRREAPASPVGEAYQVGPAQARGLASDPDLLIGDGDRGRIRGPKLPGRDLAHALQDGLDGDDRGVAVQVGGGAGGAG